MTEQKINGLLGLAVRSGKIAMGTENCLNAVRTGTALCVLVDEGVGPNTLKRVRDACGFYKVPCFELGERQMDSAMGRNGLMTAAMLSSSITEEILRHLTD